MPIHGALAQRAVRDRLWIGVLAVGFAAFCMLLILVGPQTEFGTAALASFGFTSLSLAVASILSARREESVHRLANKLEDQPMLESEDRLMLESDGVDGVP